MHLTKRIKTNGNDIKRHHNNHAPILLSRLPFHILFPVFQTRNVMEQRKHIHM